MILGARFGSMEVVSADPQKQGRLELSKINDIVLQPGHLIPGRLVKEDGRWGGEGEVTEDNMEGR